MAVKRLDACWRWVSVFTNTPPKLVADRPADWDTLATASNFPQLKAVAGGPMHLVSKIEQFSPTTMRHHNIKDTRLIMSSWNADGITRRG